jgi:hypothetical protein
VAISSEAAVSVPRPSTAISSGHQPVQLLVELGDLLGELEVAAGHGAQRELDHSRHVIGALTEPEACRPLDQLTRGKLARFGSQLLRSGEEQSLHVVCCLSACLYRRVTGGAQGADHLYLAVSSFGQVGGSARQHRAGCHFGI